MKKYTLLLISVFCLFNVQSVKAQCEVDAGEDIEVCGDTIQLNASLNEGDYDAFWSTSSSDVEFSDIYSPTSNIEFTGSYSSNNAYTCELTWIITNPEGETCSDVVDVFFKQVPSCEFGVTSPTCLGYFVEVTYLNNNEPEFPCPLVSAWTLDNELVMQETDDPCVIEVTSYNYSSIVENYPISLQVEQNGCVSGLCEDYITVFSEFDKSCDENLSIIPINDTVICGLEYALTAELSESADHGQWIFLTGPATEFLNADAGTDTEPGNPNALIAVNGPGSVKLVWKEWTGDYYIQEDVVITFLDPIYCNGLYLEAELTMLSSELDTDGSIDITPYGGDAPYSFHWFNVSSESSDYEDQENLSVGLYTLTLTDNNDQQHIKHNYLIANLDSSIFENPIDTLTATIDTCDYFNWNEGVIYNYVVVEDEIIVTWQFGDVNHMTFHTVTYPFVNNTSGVYVYTLTVVCEENGIESTAEDVIFMDFDIMNGLKNKNLFEGKIYPNPTTGIVNVDAKEVSEIILTDITGRVISNCINTGTNNKSQINISQQKSGIYLLHLKTREGQQVVKLIKE